MVSLFSPEMIKITLTSITSALSIFSKSKHLTFYSTAPLQVFKVLLNKLAVDQKL